MGASRGLEKRARLAEAIVRARRQEVDVLARLEKARDAVRRSLAALEAVRNRLTKLGVSGAPTSSSGLRNK